MIGNTRKGPLCNLWTIQAQLSLLISAGWSGPLLSDYRINPWTDLHRPGWFSWIHVRLVIRRLQVQLPPGQQHYFMEIAHEIFSMVILFLPLIQEGQLSVSGERMCTILFNHLKDKACPVKVWLGKLTALDMTPLGWLGRKTTIQTNKCTCSFGPSLFTYVIRAFFPCCVTCFCEEIRNPLI